LFLKIERTLSLRIETPCAVSSQAGYAMEVGRFAAARNASTIAIKKKSDWPELRAASDLKRLPHLPALRAAGRRYEQEPPLKEKSHE
jgi:hypothetical protein